MAIVFFVKQLISFQLLGTTAEHFLRQPALVVVSLLLCGLLLGGLGRGFGLPSLVYHPHLLSRMLNGFAFGLLFGWICFVAHTDRWMDWAAWGSADEAQSRWSSLLVSAEKFAAPAPAWLSFHAVVFLIYAFQAVVISFLLVGVFGALVRVGAFVGDPGPAGWTDREAWVRWLVGVPRSRAECVTRADIWARAAAGALYLWQRGTFLLALAAGLLVVTYRVGRAAVANDLYKVIPGEEGGPPGFEIAAWTRGDVIGPSWELFGLLVTGYVVTCFWPRFTGAPPTLVARVVRLIFTPVVVACFTTAAVIATLQLFVWYAVRGLIITRALGWQDTNTPGADGTARSYGAWLDYPIGLESFSLVLLVAAVSVLAGRRRARCRLENLVPPATSPGTPPAETLPTAPAPALTGFVWPYKGSSPTHPPAPLLTDLKLSDDDPLVVLAASGGGIVAAGWTVLVLTELERRVCHGEKRLPVRFAAGASGGMLGAAYYAATRAAHAPTEGPGPREMFNRITADFLSPVIRWWAFHDLLRSVLPFHLMGFDRGRVLERAWIEELGAAIARPLSGLREAELRGDCPSLVFSPMFVEGGQRLLISNLDFHWLAEVQGNSYRELFKDFPAAHALFPVATGARLSATFPLVSPAAVLPGHPRRRVVDAGYFDTYGVHLAAAWVRHLARQSRLRNQPPRRVAFVEVRAFPRDGRTQRSAGWAARAWEDLTTPIEGLLSAREAVMAYRNDELIQILRQEIGEDRVEQFVFNCPATLPLSWFLTEADRSAMTDAFGRYYSTWNEIPGRRATDAQREADEFQNWLVTGRRCPTPP